MKPYERITKQKECCSLVTRACTAVRQLMFSDGQEIGCSCRVGEDSGRQRPQEIKLAAVTAARLSDAVRKLCLTSVMCLLGIQSRRRCIYDTRKVIRDTDFSRPQVLYCIRETGSSHTANLTAASSTILLVQVVEVCCFLLL
jgi:hypothetical protein